MTSPTTSLLQGTRDLLVLESPRGEPTNGFDLAKRIQAVSNDVLKVNAGSLYPSDVGFEALTRPCAARGLTQSTITTKCVSNIT